MKRYKNKLKKLTDFNVCKLNLNFLINENELNLFF